MLSFKEFVQNMVKEHKLSQENANKVINTIMGNEKYTLETKNLIRPLAKSWVKNK